MSTKRLFSLILAVAMLVAIVAGCTNQNGAPISSPPAEETAAPVQSEQPTQSEEPQQVSATGKGTRLPVPSPLPRLIRICIRQI